MQFLGKIAQAVGHKTSLASDGLARVESITNRLEFFFLLDDLWHFWSNGWLCWLNHLLWFWRRCWCWRCGHRRRRHCHRWWRRHHHRTGCRWQRTRCRWHFAWRRAGDWCGFWHRTGIANRGHFAAVAATAVATHFLVGEQAAELAFQPKEPAAAAAARCHHWLAAATTHFLAAKRRGVAGPCNRHHHDHTVHRSKPLK